MPVQIRDNMWSSQSESVWLLVNGYLHTSWPQGVVKSLRQLPTVLSTSIQFDLLVNDSGLAEPYYSITLFRPQGVVKS